ncbi:MAG: hypothetical protein ACI8O8_002976 [Oleiphilaceae bacterium]|jgi:hypothetical protein
MDDKIQNQKVRSSFYPTRLNAVNNIPMRDEVGLSK